MDSLKTTTQINIPKTNFKTGLPSREKNYALSELSMLIPERSRLKSWKSRGKNLSLLVEMRIRGSMMK